MATGQFTGFPINWSDVLGSFGLVGAAGGTFTGGVTFAGPQPTWSTAASRVSIGTSSGFPSIQWMHSAGGTDAKGWDAYANGNSLVFRTLNDAATAAVNWLEVVRSGTNISQVVFNGNIGIGRAPLVKLDIIGANNSTAFGGNADLRVSSLNNTVSTSYGWNQLAASGEYIFGMGGVEQFRMGTGGGIQDASPHRLGQYTLGTLPSASAYSGHLIEVSNATGGAKVCRSNGSAWQILNTTTTVT